MIFIDAQDVVHDKQERLETGTTYDRVVSLAMDFTKNCPLGPTNALPSYHHTLLRCS